MRRITKLAEPSTLAVTRRDWPQHAEDKARAREAFDRLDKAQLRAQLVDEQRALCAYCMRRIRAQPKPGSAPFPIAHRVPVAVDPGQALRWTNLLGSCDSTGLEVPTCDAAQRDAPLSIDPIIAAGGIAKLRYVRRAPFKGLFITSDDEALRRDVETTLNLNAGELPRLREQAWNNFQDRQRLAHPTHYSKVERRNFLTVWLGSSAHLPEFAGVIEAKLR